MFEDIVIIHRQMGSKTVGKKSDGLGSFSGVDLSSWVVWKTCLREMAIGTSSQRVRPLFVKKSDQVYTGLQAYQFFLEVISGLHSPIIGETEVMGQVKEMNSALGDLVRQGEASVVQITVSKFINCAPAFLAISNAS